MSQNDFVIANQTTPLFRADLNSALQALTSNSSGSTAPTTTYANMFWYDTAANILKVRSEADDAWINVAYVDQSANAWRVLDDTQVVNTSGTQTGLLGDQSTATWEVGSSTTESLVSPVKVKAAIEALIPAPTNTFSFISRTVISGSPSTVELTFDETLFDEVIIVLQNVEFNTDARSLYMRTTSNGGSTYDAGATDYILYDGGLETSAAQINIESLGTAGGEDVWSGEIRIFGPGLSGKRTIMSIDGSGWTQGDTFVRVSNGATRDVAGIVNGVRFLLSGSGAFAFGTITMYGMRKS